MFLMGRPSRWKTCETICPLSLAGVAALLLQEMQKLGQGSEWELSTLTVLGVTSFEPNGPVVEVHP